VKHIVAWLLFALIIGLAVVGSSRFRPPFRFLFVVTAGFAAGFLLAANELHLGGGGS